MGVHYSLLMSFAKVFFNRLQMPHLFSSNVATQARFRASTAREGGCPRGGEGALMWLWSP